MKISSTLFLIYSLFLSGEVESEYDFVLIDNLCKKYQVQERQGMLECRLGRCISEEAGVELSLQTVIGESINQCETVDNAIRFDGRAYVSDYSFLFDALDCVLSGDCSKVELNEKTSINNNVLDGSIEDFKVVNVSIEHPNLNLKSVAVLEVDVLGGGKLYQVVIKYSDIVIYNANVYEATFEELY